MTIFTYRNLNNDDLFSQEGRHFGLECRENWILVEGEDAPADEPAAEAPDLSGLTLADLKRHAKENGVPLGGAKSKAEVLALIGRK